MPVIACLIVLTVWQPLERFICMDAPDAFSITV